MSGTLEQEAREIIARGADLTIATLRPDGWPQATTVSYASDGLTLYFGSGAASQKAANLKHDDRVSITINLPYSDWSQIRGLSLAGRATRVTDPSAIATIGQLFLSKFPRDMPDLSSLQVDELALFQVKPEVISVLNYTKGFGHTDLFRPGA